MSSFAVKSAAAGDHVEPVWAGSVEEFGGVEGSFFVLVGADDAVLVLFSAVGDGDCGAGFCPSQGGEGAGSIFFGVHVGGDDS